MNNFVPDVSPLKKLQYLDFNGIKIDLGLYTLTLNVTLNLRNRIIFYPMLLLSESAPMFNSTKNERTQYCGFLHYHGNLGLPCVCVCQD